MAKDSAIEWTDHTFNPWLGCASVSPACDNCYARTLVNGRMAGNFDDRRRTVASNWNKPLVWNRAAPVFFAEHGRRQRVFCASLGDVFDNQVDPAWRRDLFELIRDTQNLDWLLLTKRPQNIQKMLNVVLPDIGLLWPWNNVWLGATVENQEEANRRVPALLNVHAHIHFLSCEPILGDIDLQHVVHRPNSYINALEKPGIDWVIAGYESGPNRRTPDEGYAAMYSLRDQCAAQDVAFFAKQIDKKLPIPADLLIRQFPESSWP